MPCQTEDLNRTSCGCGCCCDRTADPERAAERLDRRRLPAPQMRRELRLSSEHAYRDGEEPLSK
jgi:hypothetical protein